MQRLSKSKRKSKNIHWSYWAARRLLFSICWSQMYSLMYNSGHSEKHVIIFVLAPNERQPWSSTVARLSWKAILDYGMGSMFGLHQQSRRQKALWLVCIKHLAAELFHPSGLTHQSFPAILFRVFPKTTPADPTVRAHAADTQSRDLHVESQKRCNLSVPVGWSKNMYLQMSHLRITYLFLREYDEGGECVALTDKTSQIFAEEIKTTFPYK